MCSFMSCGPGIINWLTVHYMSDCSGGDIIVEVIVL